MRYFGVDVGLKEGFGQMVAAFALGKATTGSFNKLKNIGNSKKKDSPSQDTLGNNENKDKLDNQGINKGKSIHNSSSGTNSNPIKNRNQLSNFGGSLKEKLSEGMGTSINSASEYVNELLLLL
ncbi:hypothetical protein JFV29_13325 [Peribacillus sp. TH16]|uniref:hypothetical protein n=1 Tax=Peribacillus sp. TH16 TaxID=2798482 RepID=UPI0019144DEF|nr:hypothetical protein [Peribacillus sp. TH16]MBK5482855.1 hypothetical protein [Peribacillus sp. TH16]